MGTGSIKTIVLLILLSALAFVAGSLASEGAKQALLPTGIVLGVLLLLCLGKHCWVCAFVAPPLISALDISTKLPIMYVTAAALLVFWLIMYSLGHVKITWHKLPILDVVVFVFTCYFMLTWVRHPVSLEVLRNPITDSDKVMLGGAEYVWAVMALLFYIFVSIVPMNLRSIGRLFKILFYVSLILVVIKTGIGLARGGGTAVEAEIEPDLGERMTNTRFGSFLGLGMMLCNYMACLYSVFAIVCSPWKLCVYVIGVVGIMLSGFRSRLLEVGLVMIFMQIVRRRVLSLFVLGGVAYGGVCLMSSVGVVNELPSGIKRVLSSVPGVEVQGREVFDAKGSLDWRYEMWDWALDPSTGYIKDYVWGDGYGWDLYRYKLRMVAQSRGTYVSSNRDFAAEGQWHSGWITAIHRTGIVGLVMLIILHAVFIVCSMRLGFYLMRVRDCAYMYYFFVPAVASSIMFYISAGVFVWVFQTYSSIAMVKVLSSMAIKEGLMPPMFQRKVYVPMMQREIEQRGSVA